MHALAHWGRVTHTCVDKLTSISSDNGLSPGRRQAIIWTNAGILLIWYLGINFSEILIEILTCSFKKMRLKVSSAKWRPCCLGLNMLMSKTIKMTCFPCTKECYTFPKSIEYHTTNIHFHAYLEHHTLTTGLAHYCSWLGILGPVSLRLKMS